MSGVVGLAGKGNSGCNWPSIFLLLRNNNCQRAASHPRRNVQGSKIRMTFPVVDRLNSHPITHLAYQHRINSVKACVGDEQVCWLVETLLICFAGTFAPVALWCLQDNDTPREGDPPDTSPSPRILCVMHFTGKTTGLLEKLARVNTWDRAAIVIA
jgi:hypothetical protein